MLEHLKSQPLAPLIASPKWGYQLDKSTSTKATAVYRRSGERLTVYLHPSSKGFYYYSATQEKGQSGTVIDFLQLQGLTWSDIRAYSPTPSTFSPFERENGRSTPFKPSLPPYKPDSTKSHGEVLDHLSKHPKWHANSYLIQRGITLSTTILQSLNSDMVYNKYKLIAPLSDLKGHYVGWSVRNGKHDQKYPDSKRITGKKGWFSCGISAGKARYIVLCESTIDALSCAQLTYNKSPNALAYTSFLSTEGQPSSWQLERLGDYLTTCKAKQEVLLCFDNDPQGSKLDELLHRKFPQHSSFFSIKKPPSGKDWNEHLRGV